MHSCPLKVVLVDTLSLVASMSTLLCCVLPALMVSLGLGAVLASWINQMPWIADILTHKAWIFGLAGILLLVAGVLLNLTQHAPCPIDPLQATACQRIRRVSLGVWWVSLVCFSLGIFLLFLQAHDYKANMLPQKVIKGCQRIRLQTTAIIMNVTATAAEARSLARPLRSW